MKHNLFDLIITGASGQLAQALINANESNQYNINSFSHAQLDINQIEFLAKPPDIIINTAAYTAVDKAESERDAALHTNYLGVKKLAQYCNKHNIKLIHLSTDYVFDGEANKAYIETDQTNPVNFYGETKLKGEAALQTYHDNFLILRVSGIFSAYGHNFINTMLRLSKEKKCLRVVDDQIACPTYAPDIAQAIYQLINYDANGIYHYCSSTETSWYAFAKYILQKTEIQAVHTSEYITAAKRPKYSVLNCDKILRDWNIQQSCWKKAVDKIIGRDNEFST